MGHCVVNVPAQSRVYRKRLMLLYVTPVGLAKCLHVCISMWVCERVKERFISVC